MSEPLPVDRPLHSRGRPGPLRLVSARYAASGEHVALLRPPGCVDSLYRWDDLLGEGAHAVFVLEDGEAYIEEVRFEASLFRPDEARTWLQGRGFVPFAFVEASRFADASQPP